MQDSTGFESSNAPSASNLVAPSNEVLDSINLPESPDLPYSAGFKASNVPVQSRSVEPSNVTPDSEPLEKSPGLLTSGRFDPSTLRESLPFGPSPVHSASDHFTPSDAFSKSPVVDGSNAFETTPLGTSAKVHPSTALGQPQFGDGSGSDPGSLWVGITIGIGSFVFLAALVLIVFIKRHKRSTAIVSEEEPELTETENPVWLDHEDSDLIDGENPFCSSGSSQDAFTEEADDEVQLFA
jgi:hypothetical protein